MAAKSAGRTSLSNQGSPRQSLDSTETTGRASPAPKETPSPRTSQDIARKSVEVDATKTADKEGSVNGGTAGSQPAKVEEGKPPAEATPSVAEQSQSPSTTDISTPQVPPSGETVADEPPSEGQGKEEAKAEDAQQQQQQQHQEEILGYVERIDALEAKLQFLAREASESARKAALAAPSGSLEQKLAEKDQQIAQLIEEGKNLASADHKSRVLVKKLRTTIADNEKELNNLKAAKAKVDKEVENLRSRARRADEFEKSNADLQKRLDQAQKELSTLRPEVRSKDSTIAELRSQLQKATEQADSMATKVNEKQREQDRRRIAELEEEVAALKVEKNLIADRGKAQAAELREKAERANERAMARELELKAELQTLEGKLEAMRIRAEEASSGAAGDSQAKLLRQIETLQTQYSIASSNWQGIETTLLARITGLERERDEAVQRESEMRRKAREAVCCSYSWLSSAQLTSLCRRLGQSGRRRSWKKSDPRSLPSNKMSRPTRPSLTLSRSAPKRPKLR
jgi:chromosome segregation ATPase